MSSIPCESIDTSYKLKKVLVVDDDEHVLQSLSFIIRKLGFEVISAKNGCDAVNVYKQNIPDIVLMDVKMPLVNGCVAFQDIKEFDRNAKIIFITAFSGDSCLLDLQKIQPCRIIEKPFDYKIIEGILREE